MVGLENRSQHAVENKQLSLDQSQESYFGVPVASQFSVTARPSVARVSELLLSSMMFGGTGKSSFNASVHDKDRQANMEMIKIVYDLDIYVFY